MIAGPVKSGEAMGEMTGVQDATAHPQSTSVTSPSVQPQGPDALVGAMVDVLAHRRPDSAAEALKVLRGSFPEFPLALRLTALASALKQTDKANGE